MLNFRNINLVFVIVLILFVVLIGLELISFYLLVFPTFLYLSILYFGVVNIHWNFFTKSMNRLKDSKHLLLTFDDGPHPKSTPKILDLLDEYHIKAIFFVIGKNAEKYPELIKEIGDRGHQIGNHSYSHAPTFDIFSVKKMVLDVEKANKLIESITGKKPEFFRPPFGITNPRINKLVKQSKMVSVGWTFRSYDTTKRSNAQIINQMKRNIKGGEIILFHDSMQRTIGLLESSLPWLIENFELTDKDIHPSSMQ